MLKNGGRSSDLKGFAEVNLDDGDEILESDDLYRRKSIDELRRDPLEASKLDIKQIKYWSFFKDIKSREGATLGMIDGVFLRCLSNIMGIIMFLRIGFMVAYAGIYSSIFIILLASSLTVLTALSLSAIATNGQISAGGVYYMISRALGAEFGGSIGVLFYLANAASVSLYCLGFAETVKNQLLLENNIVLFSEAYDERLIALMALLFAFVVCMVGVSWVVRTEKFLLFFLLAAVCFIILGGIYGPTERSTSYTVLNADQTQYSSRSNYIPGFQSDQFTLNSYSQYEGPKTFVLSGMTVEDRLMYGLDKLNFSTTIVCDVEPADLVKEKFGIVNFAVVLSVFFPAVSGIMAGANVSGDLKDPSKSIPNGTLSAIVVSGIIYILLIVVVGSHGVRSILIGLVQNSETGNLYQCTFGGLFHEPLLPVKMAFFPSLVYIGIYAATLSSALTSLVSAPRVLQALAKDDLFPVFKPLAKTVGKQNEPIRAYVVTFFIAALCIMTGNINTVAPLISTFFLLSYALVNYACYAAEHSGSPGWRPSFQYYNKKTALSGAIGCITVMLLLSAVTGFITFVIGLALYKYIETSRKDSRTTSNWGPATNARQMSVALGAVLQLESFTGKSKQVSDATKSTRETNHALDSSHVKNFRPQMLVLSGAPGKRPSLLYLANELKKAKGLNIFADIMVGDCTNLTALEERNRRALVSYMGEYGLNGFNEVLLTKTFREGVRSLIQLAGLGRMIRVNTVLMGFLENWETRLDDNKVVKNFEPKLNVLDYVNVIRDSFDLGCGVCLLRYGHQLFLEDSFKAAANEARHSLSLLKQSTRELPIRNETQKEVEIPLDETWTELKMLGKIAVKPIQNYLKEEEQDLDIVSQLENRSPLLGRNRIDVYCFADDGGLTILLPHLLRKAADPPFAGCSLRIIAIGSTRGQAEEEQVAMKSLMNRFRIEASVQVVSLELQQEETDKLIAKTKKLQRIGQLIDATSPGALLVVCTLPVPHNDVSLEQYMTWLDLVSKTCHTPILLTRGCHRDVLTVLS